MASQFRYYRDKYNYVNVSLILYKNNTYKLMQSSNNNDNKNHNTPLSSLILICFIAFNDNKWKLNYENGDKMPNPLGHSVTKN